MRKAELVSQRCPVARAVGTVGDTWTLLVLRDALFFGATRFEDFRRNSDIPTSVLSHRLRYLGERGIFQRVPAPRGNSLHEYRLTRKGEELWGVLSALLEWGNRWCADEGVRPLQLLHRICGHSLDRTLDCPSCQGPVESAHIQAVDAHAAESSTDEAPKGVEEERT